MKKITNFEFLKDSTKTGRFLVKSKWTKKTYYIEPQGDSHIDWGSLDPASGKMTTKKGWKKNKGSIDPEDSLITSDNGLKNIITLEKGVSPLKYISDLDSKYPTLK